MKKKYYNQLTTSEFIKRARAIHGDKYDYRKVVYVNYCTKVCIICAEHGEFWQRAGDHLQGKGCPKCKSVKLAKITKEAHKAKRPDLSHIETPEGSRAVPLTKGEYALVDEEDYERVMQYNWHLTKQGYAYNHEVGLMHRFIMNPPDDMEVDHIFHNKLDNRKSQLRVCSTAENSRNTRPYGKTSKYKGVSRFKRDNNWVVKITIEGKYTHVGYFNTEEEAARAYDEAAKRYHGEHGYLNFPK